MGVATVVLWVRSFSKPQFAAEYELDQSMPAWTVYEVSMRRGDVSFIRERTTSSDAKEWQRVLQTRFGQPPQGKPGFVVGTFPTKTDVKAEFVIEDSSPSKSGTRLNRLGFGSSTTNLGEHRTSLLDKQPSGRFRLYTMQVHNRQSTEIHVPAWFVVVVLIAFAILLVGLPSWAQFGRRLIRRAHRCRQCGYNLTGNTSGVCPECGTAVAKAST
jgi:hypothetical protein